MIRLTNLAVLRLSAGFGFLGVALGAFGAHALAERLARSHAASTWEKGVLYHLVHAVAMLVVATIRPLPKGAWSCFALGILAFSGSLYLYALTHVYWLVFVTPLGGVLLLAGWLWLVLCPPISANANPDLK